MVCYKKNKERGLWFESQCIEENIKLKENLGKDASFEKKLLKSYKKYKESDYRARRS